MAITAKSVAFGSYNAEVGVVNKGALDYQTSADVAPAWITGSRSAIGTSALQIRATTFTCVKGVWVKASPANGWGVWIGPVGVTADSVDATDGYRLQMGEEHLFKVQDINEMYAIGPAGSSGLRVYFHAE